MEKHFKYELDNGKVVNVPLDAVDNLKKHLQISTNEAIMVWLEDNGYEVNEELENLDKQAKANKSKNVVKSKVDRKPVVRERKPNPTKENIIQVVANALKDIATDINIENVGKIITFKVENKEFKLDLTEKRVKKVSNWHFFLCFYIKSVNLHVNWRKIGATMVNQRRIFKKSSIFEFFLFIWHKFDTFFIFPELSDRPRPPYMVTKYP